jgi:glyoxylase-like metal-dependent hydrolase (beta-lactamase superfamily II)
LNGLPPEEPEDVSTRHEAEQFLRDAPLPDLPLLGGETLEIGEFKLRPIWTPGHTPGHLCYYEETHGLLLTGDHVLPTISSHIGIYSQNIGNPLPDFLDSLHLLRAYHPHLVLPAHGETGTDLHARLDELLEHHDQRMEEMLRILGAERLTAWEVASRVQWTRRKILIGQLVPRHRRLALAETIAHLELLRTQGRLTKHFEPGRMLYQRSARA